MNKIIFNGTILSDKPNGLSLYSKNIYDKCNKDLFYKLVFNEKFRPQIKHEKYHTINTQSKFKLFSIFLRNFSFNKYIRNLAKKEDILLYSPTQHGINSDKIKQIITIHDLLPLLYPKGRFHQYFYYKYILPKIIKKSEAIITVSENTKRDIIKYYKIDSNKIHVIYNGFDEPTEINLEKSKKKIKEMYNIDSYVLMVGINYSYKNLHTIIEAYENLKDSLSYDIVIVGNYNVSYGKQLIDLTKKFSLGERVKFLGYIEDDVKHSLYQASKAFIYPSLYEGFGLPVLEAMNNRTPVVCSNSSSLPEVAGDAAIYINSSDINEIKQTLMKINNMSNEERQVWIKKGSERVNKFSWQKCVNSVEEVIRAVAKQE